MLIFKWILAKHVCFAWKNTENRRAIALYTYPSGCKAIVCGGEEGDRASNCAMSSLIGAIRSHGIQFDGILPTSGCWVGADGGWYGK
jgi:hypothetical protein